MSAIQRSTGTPLSKDSENLISTLPAAEMLSPTEGSSGRGREALLAYSINKRGRNASPSVTQRQWRKSRSVSKPPMQMETETGGTNVDYWDGMAKIYDEEVFNSMQEDRGRVILREMDGVVKRLKSQGVQGIQACDLGCGVGKWVPALALRCSHVYACDVSQRLLDVAACTVKRFRFMNVTLAPADLAEDRILSKLGFPMGHIVACANVLISPDEETRQRIFEHVSGALAQGGTMLLLLPSVESACRVREARQVHGAKKLGKDDLGDHKPYPEDEARHVYRCGGVRTQHYTRETALALVQDAGLHNARIEKVEYSWDIEFCGNTSRLSRTDLYPHDWLVVAEKG